MQQVLDSMPRYGKQTVLLGGAGRLRPFYQLMLAQESGEWQAASDLSSQLHLDETKYPIVTGKPCSGRGR